MPEKRLQLKDMPVWQQQLPDAWQPRPGRFGVRIAAETLYLGELSQPERHTEK